MASQDTVSTAPWHAAYPAPRHQPGSLTRDQVLQMIIKSHELGTRPNFVLIDLRRNDHEGGTIRGSINLPAQSLYPSIPALYGILKEAGVHKVIWYCSSSRGRGTRAAGWFGDYLADHNIDNGNMESLVLAEGVKGWATAGPEYLEWMDEYDSAAWQTYGGPRSHNVVGILSTLAAQMARQDTEALGKFEGFICTALVNALRRGNYGANIDMWFKTSTKWVLALP
ncbi:hypothetical protein S7711_05777 [Stachybotrys chartarum IBT 7711]|uniref:Rhodanese domain-containing protein n=1 Tax=Stachybotrys chartarum (strain CBS 109288 / IBT 7711) TaxID=1280523 RepID=A0A084ATG5_STACB|nr:hypothetical protein S7711_05777 [Stachybotrys chartarum IBT 7711]